jgi:hypothetical protein
VTNSDPSMWLTYIQDLATYEITTLDPALRVKEAAVGTGDLCGSVMLNRRFVAFVESKIGPFAQEYMKDVGSILKPSQIMLIVSRLMTSLMIM